MGIKEFLQSGYNLVHAATKLGVNRIPTRPSLLGETWTGVQKFITKRKSLFFDKTGTAVNSMPCFPVLAPNAISKKLANPGTVERTIDAFSYGILPKAISVSPTAKPFTRFAVPATMWSLAAGVYGIGNQLTKTLKFRPIERPSSLRAGPGYISWSKTHGMPNNHLSTDGLSLALSNMRHTSVL